MSRVLQSFVSCTKHSLSLLPRSSSQNPSKRAAFAFTPLLTQRASRGHGRGMQHLYSSNCWMLKMHGGRIRVLPSRIFCYGFSSNASEGECGELDLAAKKCVPCNSKDIHPMSEKSANELLPQIQSWNLLMEDGTMKLQRSWRVKNFTKGLEFFQLVADIAEAEGHHPDLHLVGWNNVKIEIWTHSVGGLTENDFILAAKINSLNVEHLLRKKASA
ncbi:pterin-4-alpha-carbinolamine dehydratase 2, mitochondrial-like isoform X1 [Typha angustifolia]|uniref:pterin-4-alpha-carbinolamine dehydratase 2, mitochondrial-like isoform X1 n=1 Tax=Typha angustifolia TaxID=59011 RepID=UPI003C2D1510